MMDNTKNRYENLAKPLCRFEKLEEEWRSDFLDVNRTCIFIQARHMQERCKKEKKSMSTDGKKLDVYIASNRLRETCFGNRYF